MMRIPQVATGLGRFDCFGIGLEDMCQIILIQISTSRLIRTKYPENPFRPFCQHKGNVFSTVTSW